MILEIGLNCFQGCTTRRLIVELKEFFKVEAAILVFIILGKDMLYAIITSITLLLGCSGDKLGDMVFIK